MERLFHRIGLSLLLSLCIVYPSYAFDPSCLEEVKERLAIVAGEEVRGVEVLEERYPNAWFYSDGWIVITSGMVELVERADELAFIIGHEIGHLRMGQEERFWSYGGIKSRFSITGDMRIDREVVADLIAVDLLLKAGYDPKAAIAILERVSGRSNRIALRIEFLRSYIDGLK